MASISSGPQHLVAWMTPGAALNEELGGYWVCVMTVMSKVMYSSQHVLLVYTLSAHEICTGNHRPGRILNYTYGDEISWLIVLSRRHSTTQIHCCNRLYCSGWMISYLWWVRPNKLHGEFGMCVAVCNGAQRCQSHWHPRTIGCSTRLELGIWFTLVVFRIDLVQLGLTVNLQSHLTGTRQNIMVANLRHVYSVKLGPVMPGVKCPWYFEGFWYRFRDDRVYGISVVVTTHGMVWIGIGLF